ncbi:DUF982 domain-containing protein [Rhizobium sp. LjRoot30]|uniref:DUF982 domain-containing protein n=1 Tax=Rhizobium sp. LjRoot30 TaxID=3342320 RepID=UPI003ECDE354
MKQIVWNQPLEIGFQQDDVHEVHGPLEALNCLAHLWPDRRGPQYVAARSICRAAIDGRKSAEQAREAFMTAAKEAHLKFH